MKKYKLTTQELTTYNGFQWEIGKKYTTSGKGDLCGPGFLHYYHHPLLAVLMNPIHADLTSPKMFEVEAEGAHKDDSGLKGGCTEITLIKEIPLPEISGTQRVAFSILTSLDVYKDKGYKEWAEGWLTGKDRSESAAESARAAAESAESARAAAESAESAAESAAWSAAESARFAARSARAAAESAESAAESAAWSAAWAAAESAARSVRSVRSVRFAARAAARSARSAEQVLAKLIECAEKCLEY